MTSLTDQQLLKDYSEHRSEPAFAELVHRHVNLVYSAASRMVRDAHLAEDVTQGVFVALAQNARQLTDHPVLSGWLHRTAQNIAAQTVRTDVRRREREQEAAAMNELLSAEPETVWEQVAPQLDAALGELGEGERDALLLRYFERKSAREMAQTLGVSDEAAQKRVNRAVERLREFFAKRGVTVGASGLVVIISANAVQAAPVGLAVAVSAAALAGTTTATATVTTIKTITMTALQKGVFTAAIAAALGAGIYEARQASELRAQVHNLHQQQSPLVEQIQQLQRERDVATKRQASLSDDLAKTKSDKSELLKLRGELTRLRGQLKAGDMEKVNSATEMTVRNWLARAADLAQRIDLIPETKIPEFRFLTAADWLDVAKDANLESDADIRNAASMLGASAKDEFARLMTAALNKYLEAHQNELPTEITQLNPFFPAPVDNDVLQRYELLRSGNVENVSESDRMFKLVSEKPYAPSGSGRPIVQIGTQGFIRTGQ